MNDKPLYLLGVDLAQTTDYTALTVLERTIVDTGRTVTRKVHVSRQTSFSDDDTPARDPRSKYDPSKVTVPVCEHHYAARYIGRLPIGTSYPEQVERIKARHDRLKSETGKPPILVVDQTGVGRPIVDMLRAVQLAPVAVTITGGDRVSRDLYDFRVPKRDLVSTVGALLDSDRLTIAERLKERATLTAELHAFKRSVSLKGHDSYGNDVGPWRENPHDDLVLAVAMACWFGERVRF